MSIELAQFYWVRQLKQWLHNIGRHRCLEPIIFLWRNGRKSHSAANLRRPTLIVYYLYQELKLSSTASFSYCARACYAVDKFELRTLSNVFTWCVIFLWISNY